MITLAPALLVWALREAGLVSATLALIAIGIAFSLALAWAGRTWWERRRGAGDLLFGELMLWGWLARRRSERRIEDSVALLGLDRGQGGELEPERRIEALEALAQSLETRDPYTHGHSRRVARYATMIASGMGLEPELVAKVRTAAAVHDVGKLETPLEVLNKPGALSDEEFAIVKRHAGRGAELVAELEDPELTAMVAHHHERLDGAGYPDGLAGEEIPVGARIIAVADTFDAITSTRAYRRSNPHRKAISILRAEAGTQLDADAVAAFCRRYSGLRPYAVYSFATTTVPRALQPLFGQVNAATATVASTAAGVAAATAVVGTLAIAPARGDEEAAAAGAGDAPLGAPLAVAPDRARGGGSGGDGSGRKQGGGGGGSGDRDGAGGGAPAAGSPSAPATSGPGGSGLEVPTQPGPGGLGGNGGVGGGEAELPDPPEVEADPPSVPIPDPPDLPPIPGGDDLPIPGLP